MSTQITMIPKSSENAGPRCAGRFSAQQTCKWLCSLTIIVVLIVQSVGCSTMGHSGGFRDPVNGYRNHVWANRAYNLRYADCQRKYSDDFKRGFIEGYGDVCCGGDGFVPATAPDSYWGYQYQTPEGAKCVNAWFTAYPLGAAAAKRDGVGAFHEVYISKMIKSAVVQDEASHVLPDDVPVVASEQPASMTRPASMTWPVPASQTAQPPIIQSSSFIPNDPNMSVPTWDVRTGNHGQ